MTEVRSRDSGAGLLALGRFTVGQPGYLAHDGLALRQVGDTQNPIFDGAGQRIAPLGEVIEDRALTALGLEIARVSETGQAPNQRATMGGLIWRAGLLLRMLDLSYAHLSGRESGGQKTLQHQLIKTTFTESFSLAEQIRLEAPHYLDGALQLDHAGLHEKLGAVTTKAAKLMGGNGFLLGSLNSLETLSLYGAALLSSSADLQSRVAA